MGYFNYHAKIKNKIKNDECINFEFLEEYHGIKPVLLFYFSDGTKMPVREHRFEEYFELLKLVKINKD